jgi:hypothetical protein
MLGGLIDPLSKVTLSKDPMSNFKNYMLLKESFPFLPKTSSNFVVKILIPCLNIKDGLLGRW